MNSYFDYDIFDNFIKKYISANFENIDRQDPLIVDMEEQLSKRKQFFYIADLINIKFLFTSKGSIDFLGVEPEQAGPGSFFRSIHPEDLHRHSKGRAKLFKTCYEFFDKKEGFAILSTAFRLNNGTEVYKNVHFGAYIFFSDVPHDSVYLLMVLTDLSSFKLKKHGYHYYWGNNLDNFRYPDKSLLKLGNVFSDREFEIIKLIAKGMNSEQIAETLYLSANTVNTHRRNILKKSRKTTTNELVLELQEQGVL